jgi:hypothetical protein
MQIGNPCRLHYGKSARCELAKLKNTRRVIRMIRDSDVGVLRCLDDFQDYRNRTVIGLQLFTANKASNLFEKVFCQLLPTLKPAI